LALRVSAGAARQVSDEVAVEEPLEVRVCGEPWLVTLRTPGHDHELVAGLLLAEGIVASRDELGALAHCGRPGKTGYGNVIDVLPAPGVTLDPERLESARRSVLATAACGVCGRRSIDDLLARVLPLSDSLRIGPHALLELVLGLRREQPNFARTGGLHAAGIARPDRGFDLVREDIGRHNAVDKAVGRLVLDAALPAAGRLLVVSGRTGFEIVAKAVTAGIPVLVGIGAPSSLAIATAERAGLTLIGFCRDESFSVYSGFERIQM
jgi:FdhD protein